MADKSKKSASKYIAPKKADKKINTFGAKTSSELKSKRDSVRNLASENAEKSRYSFTSMTGNQGSNLANATKVSNKYDRMSSDASYLANRMDNSVKPMMMKEGASAARSQANKLSMAPMDATGVARNSSFPLAESPMVPDYSTLTSKLKSK
jgi:hypothetical protein